MNLDLVPEAELVAVVPVKSAVFPDNEEGMIAVRGVTCLIVDVGHDDLEEALTEGCFECEWALTITDDAATFACLVYEPYFSFKVELPLPDHQEDLLRMNEHKMFCLASDIGATRTALMRWD